MVRRGEASDTELAVRMMWAALNMKKTYSPGGIKVAMIFCHERGIDGYIVERAIREDADAARGGEGTITDARRAVSNALYGDNIGREIRATHSGAFRSGLWAKIMSRGVRKDGRPLYYVVFDDGKADTWVADDEWAGYEFRD